MSINKVICLLGPTATGKTDTAIYLADQYPIELISVDSSLVYRDMNIGTAKPDAELLTKYPHHLIDILDPTERYSAADFMKDALQKIEVAFANGKIPLLVGGTFLYFKALLEGISEMPASTSVSKANVESLLADKGLAHLYQMLAVIDPETAKRLHANDSQRILRALEVFFLSGQKMSDFWLQTSDYVFPYPVLKLTLQPAVVEPFNLKMAARFDQMLASGLVDEVVALKEKYPELTADTASQKAVGYRQVWEYLEGLCSYEEMREKSIIATRQYAKRQRTWLRGEENLTQIYVHEDAPPFDKALMEVQKFLGQ